MSSGEILLTAVVALVVFGPSKLPMLATHLGKLLNTINRIKTQATLLWQNQVNQLELHENQRRADEADKHYQEKKK